MKRGIFYFRKGTDVEWRFTEEGQKVRVATISGRIIPLPLPATETDDGVVPGSYVNTAKDTVEKHLTKVTYTPNLQLFEKEIMDSMGIKEDRQKAKTYWY